MNHYRILAKSGQDFIIFFSFADGYKKADKLVRNVRRLWQKMTFSLNGADTNCRLKWNPETLEHPGYHYKKGVLGSSRELKRVQGA